MDYYDDLDDFDRANTAEMVRGRHYVEWWDEVERLRSTQLWDEHESLLCEMRDATERGAQIAGYTVAPAPAMNLARMYDDRGDRERAIAELRRFVRTVEQYRKTEPTGGDTGLRRALETLQSWTESGAG